MADLNFTPRDWAAGVVVTEAMMDTDVRDSLTNLQSAWASYTPSWTAATTNPTLGNGTITGAYRRIGKTILGRIKLTAGSTTTAGTGVYGFTLPVAAIGSADMMGTVGLVDTGVAYYTGWALGTSTTTFAIVTHGATAAWGSAGSPFVITNTDIARINFCYEAA